MTARGLFNAFLRWGKQVENVESDFTEYDFRKRWLQVAGSAPMTNEILQFLRNEARLAASASNPGKPWLIARGWVQIAEKLMHVVLNEGLPALDGFANWRIAETHQRNAEVSLMAVLDVCARAAYPSELRGASAEHGGWGVGPVKVAALRQSFTAFETFLNRTAGVGEVGAWVIGSSPYFPVLVKQAIVLQCLSRLDLKGAMIGFNMLSKADFEGADLSNTYLLGTSLQGANLVGADLSSAMLMSSSLSAANLNDANLHDARLMEANLSYADLRGADLTKADFTKANLSYAVLKQVSAEEAILKEVTFNDTHSSIDDLKGAHHIPDIGYYQDDEDTE